jgi:outer membrane protein assembly factor BamB
MIDDGWVVIPKNILKLVLWTLLWISCSDNEPPVVDITHPIDGSSVSGIVNVTADATDNEEVVNVEFYIDDTLEYVLSTAPFVYLWVTESLPDSTHHDIFAKAFDAAENEGVSAVISVLVVRDNYSPTIPATPTGPASGYVDSSYEFSTSASDPDGDSVSIRFLWDDSDTSLWSPWVVNTATVSMLHLWQSEGTYEIRAQAIDDLGAISEWSLPHSITISFSMGSLKWRYHTNHRVWSSPAIGNDGTIYCGSHDNRLYALNGDGTLKWYYTADDYIISAPAIASDGTIYVGSLDSCLHAINPDGTFKWKYKTGYHIYSSPAIGTDGTVYIGSYDHYLYALNPDGSLQWRYLADGVIWSSPAVALDGTIYFGAYYFIYALNPDGTRKWRYGTGSWIESSPSVGSDGTVYIGSGDCYLYALNYDSTLQWRYQTGGAVRSSPTVGADGTIYVGSEDYYIYALNPDGTLQWRYPTAGTVFSCPVIGSVGAVYVGSWDGHLHAIELDGTLKWSYQTGGGVRSSAAIGSDGTIYVGSHDCYLYALQGSGSLANTAWPIFRHDLKHTGRVDGGR